MAPPERPAVIESVSRALAGHCRPGDRLLVAISGGPDSVALAHALRSLPFETRWLHVDHRLRKGSARDARFVRRLARDWDIPLRVVRVNVRRHAKVEKIGIEEAARNMRYRTLGQWAAKLRCQVVLSAHNADDQEETVLLHFLRGAGPSGLAGIPVARDLVAGGSIPLVRPLLEIPRSEISAYLKSRRIPFRIDPTNRNTAFARNRLRHETLPCLSRRYPGLGSRLRQLSEIARVEENYWEPFVAREFAKTVRRKGRTWSVDLRHLLGYHKALARRILRRLWPGFSFQDIERVFTLAQSIRGTGQLQLAEGFFVKRNADKLIISSRDS